MTPDGSLLAAAFVWLLVLTLGYVAPAWCWRQLVEHRPQIVGWWHATRVAEAMRWRRDGWSWSVAWVRSGVNVHDGENFDRLTNGATR